MTRLNKCFLLPIDGTTESLKPVEFLKKLYSSLTHLRIIVCYFLPPLPPIYREKADSPAMAKKRIEVLGKRERETRSVIDQARALLLKAGLPEDAFAEHIQEKASSLPKDICMVAGFKKADALVMQKQTQITLESLFRDDPTHALLQHCAACPVWLIEGNAHTSRAAICILNEDTSLRAVDHAGFMLAETSTEILLLHATRGITKPVTVPASRAEQDAADWLETEEGRILKPYLVQARQILEKEGIAPERVHMELIPSRGNVALEIIQHCRKKNIGIVVIGHSNPTGKWSFLKSSITKKALAEFTDMAVWVSQ
ncbi:MAG: universal stress protein [Deltaproteobacteria bacterium]|nr:universal stress protein [Deltaproteobacteria bacterium]